MHPSGRVSQNTPEKCTPAIEGIASVFGNNVKDSIGLAGALDAVVDEVMRVSGAVSGGSFNAGGLGAHDEDEAEANEKVEGGRRRNREGLCTGIGTSSAFVEGYLGVGAGRMRTESEGSGVAPVLRTK